MDSDVSESTSSNENSCDSGDENEAGERVCISKKIRLPECFCVEEEVFKEVLNPNVWKTVFSSKHRERLQRLLPVFPENDEYEKNCTLRKLCRGENFKFGSPFNQVFKKFKDGFLSTDANVICKALKHANYQEYKNQQKNYSYHLFKDILLSRKKLIDASYILPPDQAVKMQQFVARPKDVTLSERSRLRYFSVLQDLHDEVGEIETSSDDDNYPEMSHNAILRQVQKFQSQEVSDPSEVMKITKTTSFPPGFLGSGNFHNHSLNTLEVSEERYREMLLSHKERCILYSHLPELISSKIDLKSIISRCNLSKRPSSKLDAVTKKKSKLVDNSDISSVSNHIHELCEPASSFNNVTVKEEIVDSAICKSDHAVPVQETEVQTDPVVVKEEQEEFMKTDNYNAALLPSPIVEQANHPTCFFSLVRDLFCDSMEQKLSASKLEEKVKNWQITPAAAILEWINLQDTWSDLVSSALKFLAGDLINILPETFVPFLDYKEKQQQWQWIGSGRDSDENMNDMCQQWLENKDDMSSDRLETSQGSPPPPRVTTGWTVRPTVEEEKKVYRQQECVRYQNPHKAFTFKVHGYEAVVGPVKGVYGKESGVNKAREHSLLTSDRPPFVTILSLVRDSAARLPNGEGTRADICELLKDSQYLASASDQQIHTVVSGALDRLHYEKDPCVKYDVNRKLWIYLHRHRTEEEFERIHQAQAAAAKARKSVQKNKILKFKNKEVVRTFTPAQTISTTENVALLNVDVPTIITSAQTSHSTRISSNSRSQTSPKANYASSNRINYTVHTVPTSSQSGIKCATLAIEKTVKIVDESASDAHDKSSALPPSSLSIVTSSEGKQPCLTSHASTQSTFPPTLTLPYTKARIGNLNPTQIVSVTPVQIKQCSTEPMRNHVHDVLNVDMKPSSPSFVGQPPVLQPILTHKGIEKQSTPVIPTTTAKTKVSLPGLPAALSGFQTIVIKQDPGLRTCGGVSAIPLLSIEDRGTTTNSAAPVVARLLHGSQYLSFSNIVANSGAAKPIQNFRVQSGNICQQMLSTSAIKVVHSGPISAIADGRLPVIALKHPLDSGKDENSTTTTSLNVCGRLLQLTNAKSVPQEAETKLADESSKVESREIAATVSSANVQTIIKVTPK